MTDKNYAEVLIDGKIYTLGGAEEEHYLQKVASYINEKISQLRRQEGFSKQSQEYQAVMVELNIADDYFKTKDQAMNAQDDMERETYNLKHELVTTQMKLEAALHDLEEEKRTAQQTLSHNANNHGNNNGNNNRNTNRK
ncbi:MAG: cell division protein ZapA [Hungatella sp.]